MRRRRPSINAPCPCGSGIKYKRCCKRYHDGASAPDPVQLVKARYAAYAMGEVFYIVDTTHPDHAKSEDLSAWRASIRRFSQRCDFVGLEILSSSRQGDEGVVTFVARVFEDGKDRSFREESTFLCCDGRWLYCAGKIG